MAFKKTMREPEEEYARGAAGLEHYERLCAMRDDKGLTWDLSGNDRAAFRWAIEQIDSIATIRAEAMAEQRKKDAEIADGHAEEIKHTSHADGLGMGNQSAEHACKYIASIIRAQD